MIKPYNLSCSFCSKAAKDVRQLIAGPQPTAICDECVVLCTDIIAEVRAEGRIRERMRSEGEVIVSPSDAEKLAWMKTWTTSAHVEEARDG